MAKWPSRRTLPPIRGGEETPSPVLTLTEHQARSLFDSTARRYFGIPGSEFVRQWKSGSFKDPDAEPHVMYLVTLLPLLDHTTH